MARETHISCDQCGADGSASVTISVDDVIWMVDLCEKHMASIRKLAHMGTEQVQQMKRTGRNDQRMLEDMVRNAP